MKQLERILLATDFTKSANSALQTAIAVAKTFNSEIIVINVLKGGFFSKGSFGTLQQTAEDNLKKTENEINKNNVKVKTIRLATGNPFDQIIKHAEFYDVNLVMIGSGEKEKGDHFKLGITANKVIRKSNKPVWVVKRDSTFITKRILCPVDFSSSSHRALENAISLARSFDAELTVLKVIQPAQSDYTGIAIMPYEDNESYYKYEQSQFNNLLKSFDFYNIRWDQDIRKGEPYQEILNAISDKKSDLIIMGAAGLSALSSILIGSVTEKVIREAPCSIITLKTEGAIRLKLEADTGDINECFKEGKELMEKGFNKEALAQFQHCLNIDLYFDQAWESSAIAHERLGEKEQAESSKMHAKQARERYSQQKIEAEMLGRYSTFGKLF